MGNSFTDTFKTFSFVPGDIYYNADLKVSGEKLTQKDICKSTCLQLNKPENIIGIQGHLWSETVRTSEQMQYMIFPRMLALAERAWHKSDWEDIQNKVERNAKMTEEWKQFANTLGYKDLGILDDMGIKYRVPPPGAKRSGNRVFVNNIYPGLGIEYSNDNGVSWKSVNGNYFDEQRAVKIRTRSRDNTRTSRIISIARNPVTVSKAPGFNMSYTLLCVLFVLFSKLCL